MIKAIENMRTLERLCRAMLIKQSTLADNRVLNALSVRGQDLSKLVDENVYSSYNLTDSAIIFEILSRNEPNENVTMNNDDEILAFSSMSIKCTIYGLNSYLLATMLKARIESQEVKSDMLAIGINIQTISYTETINEFMNETVWPRTDLTIDFNCRLNISKQTKNYIYQDVTEVEVKPYIPDMTIR